jgi:hypothetical protein
MSNKPSRPNEAEPFMLLKRNANPAHPVSNEDLSEQIASVSIHLGVVHKEAALARAEATDAKKAANAAYDAVDELRSLVIGDHAPRISQVEKKTSRFSIPPSVRRGAAKAGIGAALVSLVPVIQQLVPLIQKAIGK